MDQDDVIKKIIILILLLFVLPGSSTNLTKLLNFIGYIIILIAIILLAMTQIDGLNVFIPDTLLEKAVWIDIFVSAIIILAMRLIISLSIT